MNAESRNRVVERTREFYNRQPVDVRAILQQMDYVNYLSTENVCLCASVSATNEGVYKASVFVCDSTLVPEERFPALVDTWRSTSKGGIVHDLESLYDMVEFSRIDPVNGYRERAKDVMFNNVLRYPAWLAYTATTGVASVASSLGEALGESVGMDDADYSCVSAYGDLVAVRENLRHELEAVERMMGSLLGMVPVSGKLSLRNFTSDMVAEWVENQREADARADGGE